MKGWIIKVTDTDGFISYITPPTSNSEYSSSSQCKEQALIFEQKPNLDTIFLNGGTGELEEVPLKR